MGDLKKFIAQILFFSAIFAVIGEYLITKKITGLYLGVIIGLVLFSYPKKLNLFHRIIKILLILNIIVLGWNTFFRDILNIPPVLSLNPTVYKENILRSINLGFVELRLNRSTGIADNIHVSTLLVLYFIIYAEGKKRLKLLSIISKVILFASLNFQFILVFISYQILKYNPRFFKKYILVFFLLTIAIFFSIDYFILDGGYLTQIGNTGLNLLYDEFNYYMRNLNLPRFLFGIKPGTIPDPFNPFKGYYIPLTDIGIIGIPIQYGLFGFITIFALVMTILRLSKKNTNIFFKTLLITLLHYFSTASFIGVISTFWLLDKRKNEIS